MRIEGLIKELPEESQKLQNSTHSLTKAEANAVAAHDIVLKICVENTYEGKFNKKLHNELAKVSEKLKRHNHLRTGWKKIDTTDFQISQVDSLDL